MRLNPYFRFALYAAFAILFVTGAAWFVADPVNAAPDGEGRQLVASYLLMVHGGTAMIALMLLGALFPQHVQRVWRSRRNRVTGFVIMTFNGALIATSFGLYYAGSDLLRPWMSNIHIGAGFVLPVLLIVHILIGRRSA